MEDVFKLSRRKGSAKWQVRKRWPMDVAGVLRGEFNASTGEEDRKKAQAHLPLIAAEYERRVQEARDKLAAVPRDSLTEPEAHRMAFEFFCASLPQFIVKRPMEALEQRELLAHARSQLEAAEQMQGRNQYAPVAAVARTMIAQAGLAVPEEGSAADMLRQMLMRAFVELHRAAVAHLEGRADYVPTDAAMRAVPAEAEQGGGRTIEQLLAAYEADKSERWGGSSRKAAGPVFRLLRETFPGRTVESITREDARALVEIVRQLPTMLGKRKELEGLPVPKAVQKAKALGLPTISPKTINDGYLIHVAAIFNWAATEQWIASSPFKSLSVHDPIADEDRRDPFTVPQLVTLFSAAPWGTPWKVGGDKPGAFWVPLLCLFHGLRNGEAAGLRVEDIGEEEGVPVLRIVGYGERKLKTKESRGTLPIHPEILRLGFLEHVKHRKEAGEIMLFPEGVVNSRGQVGAKLAERFSAHVKKLGLQGRKLGMHSFRHCFEDRLREAELPQRTALALARRQEPGSSKVYGEGLSVRLKAEAIGKIAYPGLDLSGLYC